MEEWRDIRGYEGYYQVSNLGRVRSLNRYVKANKSGGIRLLKGKIMKLTKIKGRDDSDNRYVVVNLRREGEGKVHQVHRLVAEAFIPNPDNSPIPNHIDGNKDNNCVDNLEWCTYSENNKHALDTGLRRPRGIPIIQYDLEENYIAEYRSATDAARITGLDRGSICHCLNNRRASYANFIWKYQNIQEGQTTKVA